MLTLQDRVTRATDRWAHAAQAMSRRREMVSGSARLVHASRRVLDHPRRNPIRGGAGGADDGERINGAPSREAIRARIRALLDIGVQPDSSRKLYAGPSSGDRACSVCGAPISKGETEFEATLSGQVILLFDRGCADLWSLEGKGPAS